MAMAATVGMTVKAIVARRFAESGAHVCIVGRRENLLKETKGEVEKAGKGKVKVAAVSADMWQPADIERMVKTAEKDLGPVDILINNAGSSQRGDFLTLSDDDWSGAKRKLWWC
jgi:short-subunit dehydrogenase